MKVIKRDGREVEFSTERIEAAIRRAVAECSTEE